MCLIIFSWKNHSSYDLILAANRDEFYNRPTAKANYWKDKPEIFGGRDLQNGGTWMGVTQGGRFAALTNHRNLRNLKNDAPSRGDLTADFLKGHESPAEYIESISAKADQFNGFNLLLGDGESLWYYNNIDFESKQLEPGLYGLSNALLDDPWHKVELGKRGIGPMIELPDPTFEDLFRLMGNQELADDGQLPDTGLPYDREKALSPMYIETEGYGTRCSTVILANRKKLHFVERTFDLPGQQSGVVQKELVINAE